MPTPEERIAELEATLQREREQFQARLRQEQERADKAETELLRGWVRYFEFLKRTCKISCGAYSELWFSF